MKNVLLFVAALGITVAVLVWADAHDRQISIAADNYERCVKQQYHMTPIQWYEDHGEYPECGN